MAVSDDVLHSGTAPDTSLATDITNASTTITLASGTGWPAPTGGQIAYGTLDPDTANEESFTYTARSGGSLTGVTRARNGTSAVAHSEGAVVRHQWTAQEADDVTRTTLNTLGRVTAANQLLVSDSTTTLAALDVAASRIVGRAAAGNVDDLTAAQVKTLLAITGADVSDLETVTKEYARDALGTALTAGAGVTITPNDGADTITIAATGAPAFVGVQAINSAGQTVNNSVAAQIAFDGTDAFDTDAFHDPSTNNTRLTIPSGKGGKYLLTARASWTNGATVSGNIEVYFKHNGSALLEGRMIKRSAELEANNVQSMLIEAVVSLSVTDYVEVCFDNTSGSNAAVTGSGGCRATATFLGA